MVIRPNCSFERPRADAAPGTPDQLEVKDAFGKVLVNSDTMILVEKLRTKGSNITLKADTKIKNIRFKESVRDIDCKMDGACMMLKAMYVKKANQLY